MEITRLGQMDEDASCKDLQLRWYDGFDKSIYEMDNGTFMLAELVLSKGAFEGDSLAGADGVFDAELLA